jgi:tetratricopeptide (TPR) repeat protein
MTLELGTDYKAICFVDMPFGKKPDLAGGALIDFDVIYELAIRPAISEAGLEPIRGDKERTGGIIHLPMFARILLAEFMVADLTLGNPNVFYELGIRHAMKPFTTVPIFATTGSLPFDVGMVRSIGYELKDGQLSADAAEKLRTAIKERLEEAVHGSTQADSPVYQLIPDLCSPDLPLSVEQVLKDRLSEQSGFHASIAGIPVDASKEEKRRALVDIQNSLGHIATVRRGVLVELMLAYRDAELFDEMVKLCENFPDYLQANAFAKQQWAFGLNRRKLPGDRERAVRLLEELIKERGPDPETLGLLGRIHKDRYREGEGSLLAQGHLDEAISAYTKGFEADPRDYYPGVNAINLLIQRGTPEALKEAERLVPLVSFALARRGGASSSDYWDVATVVELACLGASWSMAAQVLPRALVKGTKAWMVRSTRDNLVMLRKAFAKTGRSVTEIDEITACFEARLHELDRSEHAATPNSAN